MYHPDKNKEVSHQTKNKVMKKTIPCLHGNLREMIEYIQNIVTSERRTFLRFFR